MTMARYIDLAVVSHTETIWAVDLMAKGRLEKMNFQMMLGVNLMVAMREIDLWVMGHTEIIRDVDLMAAARMVVMLDVDLMVAMREIDL